MATVLVTPLGLSPRCSLSLSKEFPREGPGDHSADVTGGRGQLGRGGEMPGGRGQTMTDRRPDRKEKPRRLEPSLEP